MTKYRESKAPASTATYDRNKVEGETQNIYEAISIILLNALRKSTSTLKKNCTKSLMNLLHTMTVLEEIFENKEQIEVSKFYESLPKPHALAVEEWLNDRVYHRNTEE